MGYLSSLFRHAEKRKTYSDLLQLDDHLLRDIGLSRGDIKQLAFGRNKSRSVAHD